MSNLREILHFGWPYIRKHKSRFIAGILLGLLFSVANGLILKSASVVMDRLDPVAKGSAPALTDDGTLAMRARIAFQNFGMELSRITDPWLPLSGRAIDWKQALGLLLLFPLAIAFRGYVGYLSSYCLGWVSERIHNELQVDVLKKLQSLSLDYFNQSTLGDLSARVQSDTSYLHRTLNLGLSDLIKEPSTVLVLLAILMWDDWKMTLIVLVLAPLCAIPVAKLGRKVRRSTASTIKSKVAQSSLLLDMLSGVRVVKAFGLENRQLERFSSHAQDLIRHGVKSVQARELVNPVIETCAALLFGGLLILLFQSGRRPGEIIVFLGGLAAIYTPLKKIAGLHILFEQSSAGVRRLSQILRQEPTVKEPSAPAAITPFRKEIRFENVSFGYGDTQVLTDLNLRIPAGQKLGIAGESGSGKSTLLNLLFRFYDPTRGTVSLDGVDVRALLTIDLRSQMALVSQEVVLFNQDIRSNIACGRLDATPQDIELAARAAFAHDFIMALPSGYQTEVSERGMNFSGGQRQRLAIARAFVRNAPILALDEATASLDSESESEVQKSIDALSEHRTVVCVAHRLATLAGMDRIIVLEKGRVVEDGGFDELLRRGGRFADMARKQGIFAGAAQRS
ncbi:MAG: ABC transporter ATP-binding protein [Verrucomicrobia bacterium]|nr:ABC transporter ATP-binding protein [Verrucomicrobiota bacterium]